MWVTKNGGFETISVADPIAHFSPRLQHFLRQAAVEVLEYLSKATGAASDRVFVELREMRLPEDVDGEFVGDPLPASIVLDLPDERNLDSSMAEELQRVPFRWRLDAAMALEEGVDLILSERG